MNIRKIRVESFEVYGLNKHKNFLEGDEMQIDSAEAMVEWADKLLSENEEAKNMAIFIHASNDVMYVVSKEMFEDGITFAVFNYTGQDNLDFFAMIDAELNFSKYGLIMQVGKTTWKIIHF